MVYDEEARSIRSYLRAQREMHEISERKGNRGEEAASIQWSQIDEQWQK